MSKGFGVIGAGLWGQSHALVYSSHPGAVLAAVCDVDAQRAAEISARYHAGIVYSRYQDLLADPSVDAISVATPDPLHSEICVAAAKAGKDILVEKPLALTVAECRAIMDAAAASGVKLMVDFHNRWNPPFNMLKQSVVAGELGEVLLINAHLNNTIFVPTELLSWAGHSATIWFTGSHLIDLACWLLDSPPRRVYSVSRSVLLAKRGIPTPDFFETTVEFANGAVAALENCWILPNSEPNIVDFKLRCIGSKGSASVDTTHNRTLEQYGERALYRDVLGMVNVFGQQQGFALESIRYFADCVIHDRRPQPTGEDGLRNTAIIHAAMQSAATGQPVDLC
jgi:predicted dehydrogenase